MTSAVDVTQEQVKKMNVYQRIHSVQAEMQTLEKRGRNDFHKYDYATEADYVHALRPLFYKYRLVVIPQLDGEPVMSTPDEKGSVVTTIKMKFYIHNIDDMTQCVLAIVPGQGQDKGDKGIYKALTGSKKYFGALTFWVATGDDPDKDEKERVQSPGKKSKASKDAAAVPAKPVEDF